MLQRWLDSLLDCDLQLRTSWGFLVGVESRHGRVNLMAERHFGRRVGWFWRSCRSLVASNIYSRQIDFQVDEEELDKANGLDRTSNSVSS